jgi:hypothetical protein
MGYLRTAGWIVVAMMGFAIVVLLIGREIDEQNRADIAERRVAAAKKAADDKAALEAVAAGFSPALFAKDVSRIEALVRSKEWGKAQSELISARRIFSPVEGSSRASEPAIVKLKQRLDVQAERINEHVRAQRTAAAARAEEERRKAEEASTVEAASLFAYFDRNEIAANQAFKGKSIRVRGTIDRIGTDILNTPYISLKTENVILSVQAFFAKSDESALARLHPGQRVVVTCVCDGKFGNVLLKECSLQ